MRIKTRNAVLAAALGATLTATLSSVAEADGNGTVTVAVPEVFRLIKPSARQDSFVTTKAKVRLSEPNLFPCDHTASGTCTEGTFVKANVITGHIRTDKGAVYFYAKGVETDANGNKTGGKVDTYVARKNLPAGAFEAVEEVYAEFVERLKEAANSTSEIRN